MKNVRISQSPLAVIKPFPVRTVASAVTWDACLCNSALPGDVLRPQVKFAML